MEPENEPLEEEIPLKAIIFRFHVSFRGCTYLEPPKTNMEPENEPLEEEIPLKAIIFRFHVSFRGCTYLEPPKTNRMAPKNDGFQ